MKIKLKCKKKSNGKYKYFEFNQKNRDNILIKSFVTEDTDMLIRTIIKQQKEKFILISDNEQELVEIFHESFYKNNKKSTKILEIDNKKNKPSEYISFINEENLKALKHYNLIYWFNPLAFYGSSQKRILSQFLIKLPIQKKPTKIIINLNNNMFSDIEEIRSIIINLNKKNYNVILVENDVNEIMKSNSLELFKHQLNIINSEGSFSINDLDNYFKKNTLEFTYGDSEKTSFFKLSRKRNQIQKSIKEKDIINIKAWKLKNKINKF